MATTPTPSLEEPGQIGAVGRMTGALFSPQATFGDIARKPSWIAPIVLLSILGLGVGYSLNQKVDWGSFIRSQAEKNPRFAQLSEEQKQRALGPQTRYAPVFSYCIGVLGPTLFALIVGGIYLGAFNLFAGAGLRFGQAFGIMAHGFLPSAIASVLAIITLLLKPPGEADPQHLLATSVGTFLGSDAPAWLTSLANSIELFWIWSLVLFAIGFAAANPKKVSTGKALGIVFGLWVLWVLIKVGWAAAFS